MANGHNLIGPTSQSERFRKLDGRGIIARRLSQTQNELIAAKGGHDLITPQQRILIEGISLRVLRCQMFIADFADKGEISLEHERRLNWHLNGIRSDLQLLGLERIAKDITDNLATYIKHNKTSEVQAS